METSNHPQQPSVTDSTNDMESGTASTGTSTPIPMNFAMKMNEVTSDDSSSSSSLQLPTSTSNLGPTELLLLQRQHSHQHGLRQEYGCTIKNDSYDYIRSVIWLLFDVSNVIFPVLGILLTLGLGLNLFCGLGYYYDTTSHTIIIDTLEHIRLQNQFINSL